VASNPLVGVLQRSGISRPAPKAPQKRSPQKRTDGGRILLVDKKGRSVRVAGPPAPVKLPGGGYARIGTQVIRVDQLPKRRTPAPKKTVAPRVERGSVIPFVSVGGRRIPLWQPIDDSGRELPRNITESERRAVQYARIRAGNQRAALRDQGNVVTNYIGETASNLAGQTAKFIAGAPVAIAAPIIGTARDLFTATNPVSLTYANKQEGRQATKRLVTRPADFAENVGRQTVDLATNFVKDPLGTFRERPLEVILTFMGGKSVVGSATGATSRTVGRTGRLARDIKQGGGVRGARQIRRSRPTKLPPGAEKRFRSALESIDDDLQAFGSVFGKRAYRASQRAADFGSKSTLPGAPRSRGTRTVTPEAIEVDGRIVRPAKDIEVPLRPRSADPITRATQRRVYEPIRRTLGLQPSYQSLSRKDALGAGYQVLEDRSKIVGAVAAPYISSLRAIKGTGKKDGLPASEVELVSELRDLVLSGKAQPIRGSRRFGLDREIENVKRTLATDGLSPKERTRYEGRLERLEAIPEEWLDPETRPARVQRVIDTARPLYEGSTAMKLRSRVISPSAAQFAGERPLIQALGGTSVMRAKAQAAGDKPAIKAINEEALQRSTRYQAAAARLEDIDAEIAARKAAGVKVGKDLQRQRKAAKGEERRAKDFAKSKMYVGYDEDEVARLEPGTYVPQRPMFEERQGFMRTVFGRRPVSQSIAARVSSARMAPQRDRFNAGTLYERGDVGATPNLPITAFTEATDSVVRSEQAAGIIDRNALKDAETGQLITGRSAEKLVERNPKDFQLVTQAQLAKISTASIDTPAGARLAKAIDESNIPGAGQKYVIPKSVYEGWVTALGPSPTRTGRAVDYLVSLWKGNVLALNPRWYIINMVGMWGQFALGAGADLQAISMARNPALLTALPGRIAWRGLPEEMGEYARRSSGLPSRNVYQRIIYKGFEINEMFESVPRKAMFWHAAKQGLRDANIIGPGPVSEARLAAAWLDVAKSAAKGDTGANQIIDEAILVTERFMGNYSRYNGFEKAVMRRVFPFYGWMRSIHRLAFALPFKHPKRAALLGIGSMMAYDLYGLEASESAYSRPGAIMWGGNLLTNVGPANIFESARDSSDFVVRFGERVQTAGNDPLAFVGRTATDLIRFGAQQAGPVFGELYTAVSGETPAGVPLRFSPGSQARFDTGTGNVISSSPTTGGNRFDRQETDLADRVIRAFTPQAPTLRRFLAGGEPYEDASMQQLFSYWYGGRKPEETARLVAPDPRIPSSVPRDAMAFITGLAGFPTTRVDRTRTPGAQAYRSQVRTVRARTRNRNALKRGENQARAAKRREG